MSIGIPILRFIKYRLSHPRSDNIPDVPLYNKVALLSLPNAGVSAEFVEGFDCKELIIEAYQSTWSFRKQTLTPQMLQNMDRLTIHGSIVKPPQIRSKLSISPAPAGFNVDEESEVFACKFRDIDASHGEEIEVLNGSDLGTNTNVKFSDRGVRTIPYCRNKCSARSAIKATTPPEPVVERWIEEILAE